MTEIVHTPPPSALLDQILTGIGEISQRLSAVEYQARTIGETTNRALNMLSNEQVDLRDRQKRHESSLNEVRIDLHALVERLNGLTDALRSDVAALRATVEALNAKSHQVANYVSGQENRVMDVAEGLDGLLDWREGVDERLDRIEQGGSRTDRWATVGGYALAAALGWAALRRR